MLVRARSALLATSLWTLLAAGCSEGNPTVPLNEGNFSVDGFGYVSPHGPGHHPLSGAVTAILAHKEIASLHPDGVQSGSVLDFDDGAAVWPEDIRWTDGFAFDHAASAQIDSDPEEDFLVARFSPPVGGEPGLVRVSSLERNGEWLERFPIEVGPIAPRAFAVGDVDGDGLSEVVVAWDDPQGLWLSVVDDGVPVHRSAIFARYSDLDLERLELALADLDADGREEIVLLGNRAPYWDAPYHQRRVPILVVLDDAQAEHQRLTEREVQEFAHADLREGGPARLVVGDFDRDHEGAEVCVTRLVYHAEMSPGCVWFQNESFALVKDAGGLRRWRRGIEDRDYPHLVLMTGNLGTAGVHPPAESLVGFEVIAADLDGDGSDELVSAWFTVGAGGTSSCPRSAGNFMVFNLPLDLTPQEIEDRWSVPDPGPARLPLDFPAAVDAAGQWLERAGSYAVLRAQHDPVASTPTTCSAGWPDFQAMRWSLVAGDQDADARDEVHVSGADGRYLGNPPVFHATVEAEAQDDRFALAESWYVSWLNFSSPPRLLSADCDGDDFRVRYTGNKTLAVGNPVPLVLMAAPPTKAGVSQQYANSETCFETSQGSEGTYSVTIGVTAGMWVGYEVSDPVGIFRASGKLKFETELAMTATHAVARTFRENFSTAHDADSIVFQGTLYESYQYEVVAAPEPSAIGKLMTIDVPVDSKVYKWTLGFYNASVAPEHAIAPEILGHTIGDPASYMRQAEATELVGNGSAHTPGKSYVGWMSDPKSLGQGRASKGCTIELEEQTSAAMKVGWSVTVEQEAKVGPFVAGHSRGLTQDSVYEVSVSRTTRYHGEVGDIDDDNDFATWNYNFGLVTYTRGLFSNAANEPNGIETGCIPYQVETYYTAPVGSGYDVPSPNSAALQRIEVRRP